VCLSLSEREQITRFVVGVLYRERECARALQRERVRELRALSLSLKHAYEACFTERESAHARIASLK
jgi:hypothetical protein